jgi:hypothetical protein
LDLENFSTQISDFDPGISPYPDGLFWTVPVRSNALDVDEDEGTASLRVHNLRLFDFFNIPNALFHTMTPLYIPATVSYSVEWINPGKRFSLTNTDHHFTGEFVTTQARMAWSAHRDDGFRFVSDPAGTSTSVFAETGEVRNGVFFNTSAGDTDEDDDSDA